MNVAGYEFEGPYVLTGSLREESGIYLILCLRGGDHLVVDVGESDKIRSRIENHDRKPCWFKNCSVHNIRYAVYYVSDETKRKAIEQELRRKSEPPCGEE